MASYLVLSFDNFCYTGAVVCIFFKLDQTVISLVPAIGIFQHDQPVLSVVTVAAQSINSLFDTKPFFMVTAFSKISPTLNDQILAKNNLL